MNVAVTNYTLRIDDTDKQKAENVFKTLGMTLSTGINVYLKAVGRQQRIPFALNANDAPVSLTEAMAALQEEAVNNSISDMTIDAIDAEIAAYRREKRGL